MGRTIITVNDLSPMEPVAGAFPQMVGQVQQGGPPPPEPDDYKAKLLKYIPAEVVSLYVSLDAIVKASTTTVDEMTYAYLAIFVVGIIGTPLYLWKHAKVIKRKQLLISTIAFIVWVFALGGPFDNWHWYQTHKVYAALVLPLYTFIVAGIDP